MKGGERECEQKRADSEAGQPSRPHFVLSVPRHAQSITLLHWQRQRISCRNSAAFYVSHRGRETWVRVGCRRSELSQAKELLLCGGGSGMRSAVRDRVPWAVERRCCFELPLVPFAPRDKDPVINPCEMHAGRGGPCH